MKQINEILEDLTDELKDKLIKSYIEDIYKLKEENKKLKLNHDNLFKLYNQRIEDIQHRDYIINEVKDYIRDLKIRRYFNKDLNNLKNKVFEDILFIIGD